MAVALNRENFFLHKLHSLTGIIPIGFYMLQHLTLNAFSLAGPEKFNGVIGFFESVPWYLLLGIEVFLLWLPILFHGIYGLFIHNRAQSNYFNSKYGWSQNRMFTFQRWSGIIVFLFLVYHVATTSGAKYLRGDASMIRYEGWHQHLTSYGYVFFVVYLIGTLCASYHLAYGVWNFCIRWGITISERAQQKVQRFSLGMFVVVTILAWAALVGFLIHSPSGTVTTEAPPTTRLASR